MRWPCREHLRGSRLCLALSLVTVAAAFGQDAYVERILPAACVSSASNYTTRLTVTLSNGLPSGFILSEILPLGWSITSATWNGSPFLPARDGCTNKWVFGIQPPAGAGTLVYATASTNAFERHYSISGQIKYVQGTNQIQRDTSGNALLSSCDRDGDSIPDDWEIRYGLSPTNAADAAQDWDSDGMSNLQEYLADTIPTNRASVLRITGIAWSNGLPRIQWQGGISATQYLERRSFLGGTGSWTAIDVNLPPTPVTNTFVDTNALGGNGAFYRLRAVR